MTASSPLDLVQPDPVSRGIHRYGKPSGERVLAGSGLDELQRLAPEPVVVTSPSILTHTKEPHLTIIESEFLQSNNRGAVHNRRGLHIDGCIQFVAKESSDACSIIEFVGTRFTMPFMLHDESSGADQRTQTENRTKNRSQRRNEHGSDNADDAGHQQYPEHQF